MRFDAAVDLYLVDLREQKPGTARAWSSPLRRAAQRARKEYGPPTQGHYKDDGDLRRARARRHKPYPGLGAKSLDRVTNADLVRVIAAIRDEARTRVNGVRGKGAEENAQTALRAFYKWARRNGYTTADPDSGMSYKKRGKIGRRAFTVNELAQVQQVFDASLDPELARVFLRLALETGARHAEMLNLTVGDLDEGDGTVRLIPKGFDGTYLEQPVTVSLFEALRRLPAQRMKGRVKSATPLLLNRNGQPVSRRYFEHLCEEVRAAIPALGQGNKSWFTTHALRHTAATMVERAGGEAVARLFLGHAASSHTQDYVSANIDELRATMVAIWGEPLAGRGHGYGVNEAYFTRLNELLERRRVAQGMEHWELSDDREFGAPSPREMHELEQERRLQAEAEERILARLGLHSRGDSTSSRHLQTD